MSCLNLQPVLWRRQDGKRRRSAADHRDFIATIKPGALIAIFVDLIGQILMIRFCKSQAREKFRNAGEEADTTNLVLLCLRQKRLDQPSPAAAALAGRVY